MKVTQEELNEFWQNVEAILATECPDIGKVMPYYRKNYQPIEGQDFSVLAKIVSDIVQYDLKTLKRMMCMVHMSDDKNLEDFFILIEDRFYKRNLFDFEIKFFARSLNYDFFSFITMIREALSLNHPQFNKYSISDEGTFEAYMFDKLKEHIESPRSALYGYKAGRISSDQNIKWPSVFIKNISGDDFSEEASALKKLTENVS
ncbi:MAG: hypothetical protein GY804_07030 [Alphaproteobacteria bacterium]|nr:hypothetical protein [Alphaproteobacteria bacterium]